MKRLPLYHILAILTVAIWGTTFVSTKILLIHGLTPVGILFYRFIIAYAGLVLLCHHRLFADNLRDELLLMCAGLTGGTLYFVFENTALQHTLVSNVSLLISVTPIFTILLARCFFRERISPWMLPGSLLALGGSGMVIINEGVSIEMNPLGDALVLGAALSWAFYTMIIRMVHGYSVAFITRKVFFYSILSLLVYFLSDPISIDFNILARPAVWLNLVFLSLVASLGCFLAWNAVVRRIGSATSSNYLYFQPVVTLATSALVLDEPLTPIAIAGAIFIISGVYIAERRPVRGRVSEAGQGSQAAGQE